MEQRRHEDGDELDERTKERGEKDGGIEDKILERRPYESSLESRQGEVYGV